jgi:twitching motility protein PilT
MAPLRETDISIGSPPLLSVETLLSAILDHDGDALVMHVGEQPTIVTHQGPVILPSPGPLTLAVMDDLLGALLPPEAQQALQEYGAVEADVPHEAAGPERFTVIAARGGDDIWLELRRQRALPFEFLDVPPPPAPQDAPSPRAERPDPSRRPPPTAHVLEPQPAQADSRGAVAPAVRLAALDRLLRTAAAMGAEALYLFSQARPSVRVDGEIAVLHDEPVLSPPEVEALLVEVLPERRDAESEEAEWIVDLADVGRVRCVRFRDHRGAGGVFRLIPARAISAEQLGLSREIQGLCAELEGLVLVVGPRSSGKSTLMGAFVDLISRARHTHVITLESRIKVVHEHHGSLVSQREVRGGVDALLAALRAALRENPDVLVIEEFRTPGVIAEAIEAASAGHLVIAGMAAHSASSALERIVEQVPPERRGPLQVLLAESLRGVVGQVLLRKSSGGRVAARELLLNTAPVAQLIAGGKLSQVPIAMESGRRAGMVPMTDALVAFVQSGVVEGREAYRKAADRPALLKALRREGLDISFVSRLA